ncbi:hypothetical protein V2A60_001076 [Cordyceps javanica]|uniref:2EXR domain-containing protein n=1 Tax=Cordyceps javanica TaxID=43265 RepID=A0A545V2H2_9HYPO|nr:hypothetical protein IF1G_05740 [Cordyceps javanica]TQW06890.1 hypothetical protein IF2G_05274 [Cordyceps javanica]
MSHFDKFQDLPPELRARIWELARERRRILVRTHRLRPAQSLLRLPLLAPVPPLLHACRESRRCMMMAGYHKAFFDASPSDSSASSSSLWSLSSSSSPSSPSSAAGPRSATATATVVRGPPYTWVDYSHDVLCIAEQQLPVLALGPRRHLVRHVEVLCNLSDRLFYTSRRRCFRHGAALFELSRLQTAMLITEDPGDGPVDRWSAVAFGVMIDCYATCRPVSFDVRVIDVGSPKLGVLTAANFRRRMAGTRPVEVSDLAGLDIYTLSDAEVWTAWDTKNDAGWKHVGCECQHATLRAQRY